MFICFHLNLAAHANALILFKIVFGVAFNSDLTKEIHVVVCRKKLARRLLFDHHKVNKEHETIMITKIKRQQGGQYTSKMEGMVRYKRIIFIFFF